MSRWSTDRKGPHPLADALLHSLLNFSAIFAGVVIVAILAFLFLGALPALKSEMLGRFLTDAEWRPGSDRDPQFGIAPMLMGSLAVTLLATLFAVFPGISGAILSHFYLPKGVGVWTDRSLELLAGVPSVIFGFWGLTVLVPAINHFHPPGQSLLAAGLVLGLMILPTVGLTARAAFRSLDPEIIRNATALGISRPTTILRIALPACRSGIGAGIVLALTRAIGETLAVVMVCGNIARFPNSIFDPVRPVTATIALEMGYATEAHRALLYTAGLLLLLLTGSIVVSLSLRTGRRNSRLTSAAPR